MNDKNIYKYEPLLMPVLTCILGILVVLFSLSKDFFWTFLFLLVFGVLFFIAPKFKNKLLLRLISSFGISHLIIFPYIYVLLLQLNPFSFLVSNSITEQEKGGALKELYDIYTPSKLNQHLKIVDSVVNLNDGILDTTISFLLDKNILLSQNFLFHRASNREIGIPPTSDLWTIIICDSAGGFLHEIAINNTSKEMILKTFLNTERLELLKKMEKYDSKKQRFESEDIWSYSRILWYSINIFDSKHFEPNSRGANIIYFLHRFIIYMLLVFIGANTYNVILNKQRN